MTDRTQPSEGITRALDRATTQARMTPAMKRAGRIPALLGALAVFSGLFLTPTSARVLRLSPPELEIQVVPEALELGAGEAAAVQVVLRNTSDKSVSNLALSLINNTELEIKTEAPSGDRLAPGEATFWVLQVTQGEGALDSGVIHLHLDYRWIDEDTGSRNPIPGVLFGTLTVTTPQVRALAEIAQVEVKSTIAAISAQKPGFIHLIVENKLDTPLQMESIAPQGPAFIMLDTPQSAIELPLAPREKRVLSIQVQPTDIVQPGKHLVVFSIDLTWREGGRMEAGTLVASHEMELGVFGESQILTLLGIPSLFLLPGFLMIVAFRMLWGRTKTEAERNTFFLKPNSTDFWFVAISLSLLVALLYPPATGLILRARRNYLEGYGLYDIFVLWFGSLLLSAGFYLAYDGLRALRARFVQLRMAKTVPTTLDDPAETLRKLAHNKLNLKRERALVRVEDTEYAVFLLQNRIGGQTEFWVAPRIYIRNRNALDEGTEQEVYDLLDRGDDIEGFLDLLMHLRLAWDPDWPEKNPIQIAGNQIVRFEDPKVMVEFR
ncbi:MAG TPA: hypothetical protein VJP78_01865 [Thermoleophilia bacterium]|nr:hypothetical protein [Thermoleophilia bacterium]